MKNDNALLKWWITISLIGFGFALIFFTGLVQTINKADVTKLSFVIGGLFIYFSLRVGVNVYRMSAVRVTADMGKAARKFFDLATFAAKIFLDLGMIGTVIGFIYMLATSFGSIELASTSTLKLALQNMGTGMSTALYTTAAGLVFSVLLRIQLYPFDKLLKERADA